MNQSSLVRPETSAREEAASEPKGQHHAACGRKSTIFRRPASQCERFPGPGDSRRIAVMIWHIVRVAVGMPIERVQHHPEMIIWRAPEGRRSGRR